VCPSPSQAGIVPHCMNVASLNAASVMMLCDFCIGENVVNKKQRDVMYGHTASGAEKDSAGSVDGKKQMSGFLTKLE